jgi:hypothetical protein
MQRLLAIVLTLGAIGVACCYAQNQKQSDASTSADITALQRSRFDLLQQRIDLWQDGVSTSEAIFKVESVNRQDVIRSQIDLINARLDYARSNADKRKLLTDLHTEYGKLIKIAESTLRETTPRPRQNQDEATSQLLLLKSERVRIQISRDTLH